MGDIIERWIISRTDEEWADIERQKQEDALILQRADGTVEIVADDLAEFDRQLRQQFGAGK